MTVTVIFLVSRATRADEMVCVVGSQSQLGSWNPANAIKLCKNELNNWTGSVNVDSNSTYSYRYFVCKTNPSAIASGIGSRLILDIVQWETHKQARQFETGHEGTLSLPVSDFGIVDGVKSESKGWLMANRFEVQIRLHSDPIILLTSNNGKEMFFVKCIPVDYSPSQSSQAQESSNPKATAVSSTEVLASNLNSMESAAPSPQDPKGIRVDGDDFVMFRHRSSDLRHLGFKLDVSMRDKSETSSFIGSAHLLPENLLESQLILHLPIVGTCGNPVGTVNVDLLVVRPVSGMTFDMELCDQSHWDWRKPECKPLDIGHRGMGGSYLVTNYYKENTVASFNAAHGFGAEFIETDILLTKDLVPVIYHDFSATVAIKNKRDCQSISDIHMTPIHDLTLKEVMSKKFYTSKGREINDENPPIDVKSMPFPTLAKILEDVDKGLGFDLEFKYPQMEVTGNMEADAKIDLNTYVDSILKVIYEHAGSRPIFFSTFHPDICILLKLKQTRYPVTFLSQGSTKLYTKFKDFRSSNFSNAYSFAIAEEILGLVLHTEVLLQDLTMINQVLQQGLVLFVWGEHNNDPDLIEKMRQHKVNGVIYDRMDLYKPEHANSNGINGQAEYKNNDDSASDSSNLRRKQENDDSEGSACKQHRY